jgi:superfamily II DNA or RNA helicase
MTLPAARSLSEEITTGQGALLVPEEFQTTLIDNITDTIQGSGEPPCLLRAPTGSGKTFILSRVLGNVSTNHDVIWLWFVPYVTLLQQTLDALATNATELSGQLLSNGLNQQPSPGQVLLSTTSGVSRASWRKAGYDMGGGESARTPAEFIGLARSLGYEIGVIIDEAHIALDEATEFGHFIKWLAPNYLAMATATPKSQRINQFLSSAGKSSFESFGVSRSDVVKARLNKAYIEAVMYQLGQATHDVADLKVTVIKQAWRRNLLLQRQLDEIGIVMEPLLLVQVENGEGTIEAAEKILMHECGVSPHAIGKHSADAPDPVMMSAIANDTTKKVLIFKQSAGTGFDAPRAAVLATTKSVNDQDFAMQYVGRVMRVAKPIRHAFTDVDDIPPELNTAYIYLANAEAQAGYQAAVNSAMAVKSRLEGETEKMVLRHTKSGAQAFTNRPTRQKPLSYAFETPTSLGQGGGGSPGDASGNGAERRHSSSTGTGKQPQGALFTDEELDTIVEGDQEAPRPSPQDASTEKELEECLRAYGIRLYHCRRHLPQVPISMKRENRPSALDMAKITERAATQVTISPGLMREAQLAARDRLKEVERHVELTQQKVSTQSVRITIDRNALAKQANAVMSRLPNVEQEDRKILVSVMARQTEPHIREALEDADQDVDDATIKRMCRYAAHWLIRASESRLAEAFWSALAEHAETAEAEPLPDALLFAEGVPLLGSEKHLYGVLPPDSQQLGELDQHLEYDAQRLMDTSSWKLQDREFRTARFDFTFALNSDELRFAEALDRADFISWWFRNPEKKRYAVRVVRGDHKNYFYPDFVVCLSHIPGDTPIQRLVETKHDIKDAIRKARHTPPHYGKVMFLTQDGGRYHVINQDGSIGEEVDFADLAAMREEFKRTIGTVS